MNNSLSKEELQKIIEQFDEETLKREAFFGIFQYGGGSDESFIKANKEGLELFALEILKAARDAENTLADTKNKTISLGYFNEWVDDNSDTCIHYIEPIAAKPNITPKKEFKSTITDKLIPFGCGFIFLLLAASVIIGLVTLVKWLF